jgi:CHASE2 domain-containing sensor protein
VLKLRPPLRLYLASLLTTCGCLLACVSAAKADWPWWFFSVPILLCASSWFVAMIAAYHRGMIDELRALRDVDRESRERIEEQRRKAWLN